MAMTSSGYSLQVGVRVDTTTIATQLDSFAKGYTLRINAEVNGQQGLNNLVSSVSLVNQQVQTLNGNLNHMGNQLSTNLDNATRSATNFSTRTTNGLKQVGRQAENTGKSLSQVIIDQARTRLVTEAITLMIQGFGEAINIVKEFDDALTEMKKVSDLSGEALDNYTKKLGELGAELGRTRAEMVESATSFIKSGYSEQDSAELARIAELYRNIADEELSSAESANFIVSQMKAFGDETEDFAMHSIDAINNVSNNMAVSSANIATALSKTSSAMGALGNSYEETLGLVTAGSEVMQGQSAKVARGLRTIGNNIGNLAQQQKTLAIETQNGTKQIELFDEATGDMKNTYQILEQIASYWDEMNNAQKQAIGISLAGRRIGLACNSLKYGKDGVTTMTVLYNYNMVA